MKELENIEKLKDDLFDHPVFETKEEYPFLPELTEEGKQQAQDLMTKFEKQLNQKAVEVIQSISEEFYFDILNEVESDQWQSYRSKIVNALCDYGNKANYKHDFDRIRKAIYSKHKEEIVKDLNQDLLDKIKYLEKLLSGPF